ncbi:MAG TPA: hypothetical protein VGV59_11725 [Pyrinomonadaceae bacterium]|nr:hypothetical protein [Pyrinomonadaceae bacterium]
MKTRTVFAVGAALALCLSLPAFSQPARATPAAQRQAARRGVAPRYMRAIAAFDQQVRAYVTMREGLEEKLPKLSKDSTPEQIETHKTAFQQAVRAARSNAKRGEIFSPVFAEYIRATIRNNYRGRALQELREAVMEAETQGVALRVNYPYPESNELVEMPPALLLRLPQLPKQVKYRFVGRNMLLVDRENGLIIDYMTNALP